MNARKHRLSRTHRPAITARRRTRRRNFYSRCLPHYHNEAKSEGKKEESAAFIPRESRAESRRAAAPRERNARLINPRVPHCPFVRHPRSPDDVHVLRSTYPSRTITYEKKVRRLCAPVLRESPRKVAIATKFRRTGSGRCVGASIRGLGKRHLDSESENPSSRPMASVRGARDFPARTRPRRVTLKSRILEKH